MSRIMNAIVSGADRRFYPEIMASQVELVLQHERGKSLFRVQETRENSMDMYRIFQTGSLNEMNGRPCRIEVDDCTGEIMSIRNLIYDNVKPVENEPIV